jgi:hypothetical protein
MAEGNQVAASYKAKMTSSAVTTGIWIDRLAANKVV